MVRSLSFIQLFIILTVGYIGGVLLYRGIPEADFTMLVRLYDYRAASGESTTILFQIASVLSFYIAAILLSINKRTRFLVLLIGAVKSVLFGLSSAHILASGVKMLAYAGWWFPFQLGATFLVLSCCWIVAPPFFSRNTSKQPTNLKLPILITGVGILVFLADKVVYKLLGS